MFKKLMIQLALVIGLSLTIPMTACAYIIEVIRSTLLIFQALQAMN